MEADFCIEVLQQAMATYHKPTIFNTDHAPSSRALAMSIFSLMRKSKFQWTAKGA
jgi:hypothetical protein